MRMYVALFSSFRWKKRSSKAMMRRGRKRRRRRRGEDWVAPEIPLDLQTEILARLPAISLMRFKCVSKLWFSLIRSRYFSNRYLTVASTRPRPPRLLMSLVDHLDCGLMEVCQYPLESVLLSSSSTNANSFDQDLTMPGIGGRNMVTLRGLILYIVCRQACIYNPTTRQGVTLPAVKSNIIVQEDFRKSVHYFLGHDLVLDQYKVFCTLVILSKNYERITHSEHWVFVLEARGSWKRIEFDQPHLPTRPGVCINGVIYYMASIGLSIRTIVSIDVRSQKFNMSQTPHVLPHFGKPVGFIEYGGKPAIINHTDFKEKGLVDLWILEDAGKWSRKSLVLQPCQLHLVDNRMTVEGTTQNGDVIFALKPLRYPYYILYYDLQNNDLRKVRIRGIPDHWFGRPYASLNFYLKHMDKHESIMHLEI